MTSKTLLRRCQYCGNEFEFIAFPSKIRTGRGKFCSPFCRDKGRQGRSGWISWNEHFFDELSPDAAYMLGFLIADGFVLDKINPLRGNSRIYQISFAQKNTTILERMADILEFEGVLKDAGNSPCKQLKLGSKHAWHIITEKYGIPAGKEKSYTARIPDIVKEDHAMLPHFIRGLFDGDGYLSKNGYQFGLSSGSEGLVEDFINVLVNTIELPRREKIWEKGGFIKRDGTRSGCWFVRWSSPYDSMTFARYIYGPELDVYGGDLFLERRKRRFDQLFVPWRDRDWLFQKFVVEGKSPRRMAASLPNIGRGAIGTWINIYGLRKERSKYWNLELGL